jgi:hypothetical protein
MEGRGLSQWRPGDQKIEPWRVYRPVVADSHPFDEEQDPYTDPDPHLSEKLDRICIIVLRIRNLQYSLWLREF